MKKFVSAAVLAAALAVTPATAFAKSKHHHDTDKEVLLAVSAGAVAGAVVAGPIGAVVGGAAGYIIIIHH